jgi:hypothetical protein
MLEKEIIVAPRMIDSGNSLAYYTKYPTGLIWLDLQMIILFIVSTRQHIKEKNCQTKSVSKRTSRRRSE